MVTCFLISVQFPTRLCQLLLRLRKLIYYSAGRKSKEVISLIMIPQSKTKCISLTLIVFPILSCIFVSTVMVSSVLAAEITEVLVYRNESMPWCGTVNGKDAGITVDILREVSKHGGPKFRFESLPWPRAQVHVQEHAGTAIIPFTRTPTREGQHTWIIQLVPNQIRLTLTRKSKFQRSIPTPVTLESMKSLPIGVIRRSSVIPFMKKIGFTNLEEVDNAKQNVQKLVKGRIAAMAESKWVDNYHWNKKRLIPSDLLPGPNIGTTQYIYLGAARNFPPELTRQIREAMSKVEQSGTLEAIYKKWTNF